ncbi:hypothetical protein [Methanococcus voltae]|uniref:Uncharacterized protein n=1 Tax=Methanococcus voltae (strain ATCC BAA-1334 / A3) TaxID=456320 RepID=D7DSP3_METV3|nr:hypothetical protein [Methanococcus voltae]MCS3901753.1 succinate-acetate transporter protein [Methanococcus voltae]
MGQPLKLQLIELGIYASLFFSITILITMGIFCILAGIMLITYPSNIIIDIYGYVGVLLGLLGLFSSFHLIINYKKYSTMAYQQWEKILLGG